jgi:hypothetical protein
VACIQELSLKVLAAAAACVLLQRQLANKQQDLHQAQLAATAAQQQLQHKHIAAASAAADAQQQAAAADAVAGATRALHDMRAGLAAALGGLQHQLLLTEAKARLLEPLATRKGLQVSMTMLESRW